jgi:hypothetical protein
MSSDFTEKELVFVSSSNRLGGTSSNFSINLSNQIKQFNNYDTVSLLLFACPKSYYLINSSNNTFTVNENGAITTITITSGNYNFFTLGIELQTRLASCSWTYVVTALTLTDKYRFSVSSNSGIQPIFSFTSSLAGKIIGFESTTYTFTTDLLTSYNVANIQLTNTLQLCCDFVQKSVLSTIIPNAPNNSTILYSEYNSTYTSQPLTKTNFTSANFYLLDGNTGSPIDLNGLDFDFTFAIFKKNDFYKHMLQDRQTDLYIKSLEEELNNVEKKLSSIGKV